MKRFIKVIALTVLVFGAAEAGARALAPGLVEPLEWFTANARKKADQMDYLGERGGASVVFVGTSMARDGLDPIRFLEASSSCDSAYNAALGNGGPIIMQDWLTQEVVPRLQPDLVVWGLESFVLNDGAPTLWESNDIYAAAPRSQRDPVSRIETWLDKHLYIFRYQQVLREPAKVYDALRGRPPEPEVIDIPWEMNWLGRTTGREHDLIADADIEVQGATLRDEAFIDFTIGGPEFLALEATVEWLQDRDIAVAFVLMPVLPEYLALHRTEADYRLFIEQANSLAERAGIPVFSPMESYTESDFADLLHLNGAGTEKFTMEVSQWLSDLADQGVLQGG